MVSWIQKLYGRLQVNHFLNPYAGQISLTLYYNSARDLLYVCQNSTKKLYDWVITAISYTEVQKVEEKNLVM